MLGAATIGTSDCRNKVTEVMILQTDGMICWTPAVLSPEQFCFMVCYGVMPHYRDSSLDNLAHYQSLKTPMQRFTRHGLRQASSEVLSDCWRALLSTQHA